MSHFPAAGQASTLEREKPDAASGLACFLYENGRDLKSPKRGELSLFSAWRDLFFNFRTQKKSVLGEQFASE
jgi:hypothetical protein